MADSEGQHRAKRRKLSDSKDNPYLAHLKEEEDEKTKVMANPYAHMQQEPGGQGDNYTNGYTQGFHPKENNYYGNSSRVNGAAGTLARFPRHKTTAAMARKAEDGPNNPFTGKPLSEEYFNILNTRRNLPVQAQRCVGHSELPKYNTDHIT